jgi:hypothetical protein
MADSPNLPARPPAGGRTLDRSALERVLERAARLQSASGSVETTDELTEQQILDLGKEVGLSPEYLKQAMAEERTRVAVPDEHGFASQLAGPGMAAASRTVAGSPAGILAGLDAWMQREECLRVKRRFPERLVWEPGSGIMNDMARFLNLRGRGYHLRRASEVSATVVEIEPGRVLVRMDADLRPARSTSVGNGVLSVASGALVGTVAAALGVMLPVAVLPALAIAGGGSFAARHSYRVALSRAQLGLEQVLDRLEHGEIRAPVVGAAIVEAAIGAITRRR